MSGKGGRERFSNWVRRKPTRTALVLSHDQVQLGPSGCLQAAVCMESIRWFVISSLRVHLSGTGRRTRLTGPELLHSSGLVAFARGDIHPLLPESNGRTGSVCRAPTVDCSLNTLRLRGRLCVGRAKTSATHAPSHFLAADCVAGHPVKVSSEDDSIGDRSGVNSGHLAVPSRL